MLANAATFWKLKKMSLIIIVWVGIFLIFFFHGVPCGTQINKMNFIVKGEKKKNMSKLGTF